MAKNQTENSFDLGHPNQNSSRIAYGYKQLKA